jgi:hypothetical protein
MCNPVRLRDDAGLRQQLVTRGRLRAHRYRRERTPEVYLEEMARLDGLPPACLPLLSLPERCADR